jgi:hypothetical protein
VPCSLKCGKATPGEIIHTILLPIDRLLRRVYFVDSHGRLGAALPSVKEGDVVLGLYEVIDHSLFARANRAIG